MRRDMWCRAQLPADVAWFTDQDPTVAWFTTERPVLLAAINTAASTRLDTHAWQRAWGVATILMWERPWPDQTAACRAA